MSVLAFDPVTRESPLGRSIGALTDNAKHWDVDEEGEIVVDDESPGVFALARVVHRSIEIFKDVESTRFLAARKEATSKLAYQVELLKKKRDSSSSNFVKLLRAFIYWVAWVVATGSFSGSIFDAAEKLKTKVATDAALLETTSRFWPETPLDTERGELDETPLTPPETYNGTLFDAIWNASMPHLPGIKTTFPPFNGYFDDESEVEVPDSE